MKIRSTKYRLNAPFGARCFLTTGPFTMSTSWSTRLNAPFGARCFLTPEDYAEVRAVQTAMS